MLRFGRWIRNRFMAPLTRGRRMKTHLFMFRLFMTVSLALGMLQSAFGGPPARGGTLPDFSLEIPKDPTEKAYLGLSGEGSFKISQIRADVVITEIFSLYCPSCQAVAPGVKEFYSLLEKDPATGQPSSQSYLRP